MKYCYLLSVQGHGDMHYLKMIFSRQLAEDSYYYHPTDGVFLKAPQDIKTLMEQINEVDGVSRIGEKVTSSMNGGHIHIQSNNITVKLSTFDMDQIQETARVIARKVAAMFEDSECHFYLHSDVVEAFNRLNSMNQGKA
jgi:hypothetical protein